MKQARFADCTHCPLWDELNTLVSSYGPKENVKLIVVGESPGQTEAALHLPFVGPSGKLLREVLRNCGLDDIKDVFYTNTILCWPRLPDDKEAIKDEAIEACKGRLQFALSQFGSGVPVLALGRWAQDVLGLSVAERWEKEQLTGKWAIGGLHPAAILHAKKMGEQLAGHVSLSKVVEKAVKNIRYPQPEIKFDLNPWPLPDLNQDFGWIALDVETTGTDWYLPDVHIFMVGIATERGDRWIFDGDILKLPEFHAWLRALFAHHKALIGNHNMKFDALMLRKDFGVALGFGWDTIAMVNTYHEYWHKGLKELATYFFDADDYEQRLVKNWLASHKGNLTYADVPAEQMREYLFLDVEYTLGLAYQLWGQLRALGRWEMPFLNHEMPQANMLTEVEWNGFRVDLDRVKQVQALMERDLRYIKEEIEVLSEGAITKPTGIIEVTDYLFKTLKLPVLKRTEKTGKPSIDEDTLTQLLERYKLPVLEALLTHKRVHKLKTSYLDNLSKLVVNDISHPIWQFWNVVTHRLSAKRPAVQTIPHKDEKKDEFPGWLVEAIRARHGDVEFNFDYGTKIKTCYAPRPGNVLITCDGTGWEMMVATAQAAMAGFPDKFLEGVINSGGNVHSVICDMLYGPGWTKAQRVREKNIYFGWQYKGTVYAFVMETGLPEKDVQKIVDWLDANLLGIVAWQDRMFEQARTGKIVIPFFNYTMHFDMMSSVILKELRKCAVNYPTQAAGSMIISRAAYQALPTLKELDARIVATVHDDVSIDVPIKNAYEAGQILSNAVVEAARDFYPDLNWQTELSVGRNWGNMRPIELKDLAPDRLEALLG